MAMGLLKGVLVMLKESAIFSASESSTSAVAQESEDGNSVVPLSSKSPKSKKIFAKDFYPLLEAPQDQVIQAALAGNELAFENLFQHYYRYVYRVCLNHLGMDREHAHDLCQEAFISAFERLERLRDHSRFIYWLAQIARNKCLSFTRRQRIAANALREFEAINTTRSANRPWAAKTELIDVLIRTVEDADLRETVHLFYLEGKRTAEIARLQNLTQTAVTSRLNRFRIALKRRMVQEIPAVIYWMPTSSFGSRPRFVLSLLNRLGQDVQSMLSSMTSWMPTIPFGSRPRVLLSFMTNLGQESLAILYLIPQTTHLISGTLYDESAYQMYSMFFF